MNIILLICVVIASLTVGCTRGSTDVVSKDSSTDNKNQQATNLSSPSRKGDFLIREEGWEIPDLTHSKITAARRSYEHNKSVEVYVTSYKRSDDSRLIRDPLSERNCPSGEPSKISVVTVNVFDVDKRKFCYVVFGTPAPCPNEVAAGPVFPVVFYDNDGDGRFESVDMNDRSYKSSDPVITYVPEWVRK